MTTITSMAHGFAKSSSKAVLVILFMIPFLATGEPRTEQPIESLASISGEWSGDGKDRAGGSFSITYFFHEDGAFECLVDLGLKKKKCKMPPGTMTLKNGILEWETERGIPYSVTLSTSDNGKRSLTGVRADGVKWTVVHNK